MLKTLAAQVKEFKKDSILTPVFMILEVLFETMIPLLMASIIDKGVETGDINHIYKVGSIGSLRSVGWCHGRKIWLQGIHRICQKFKKSHV